MYTPTSTLLTFLPFLLFLTNIPSVSATPPACLLAAINAQTNPSDLKTLCGTLENVVLGNVTEKCGSDGYKEAVSAYQSTCFEGAGVNITITSTTSSTKTNSGTASATAIASGTGAKTTGSATATGTNGSTTASATGSTASASETKVGNGSGALVVPGLLGVVVLVCGGLF